MSWNKDEYERTRLAYNAQQDEKRKHERIAKALETLRECGVIGDDEDLETLRQEHGQFRDALISLAEERDELDARLSGDALHQENETLRQAGRDRDWRDAWRETARAAGMHERAIDHAWKHHGPKAESDEPNRKAIQATVAKLKAEHDYLWPAPVTEAPADAVDAPASSPAAAAASGPRFTFSGGQWRSSNGTN